MSERLPDALAAIHVAFEGFLSQKRGEKKKTAFILSFRKPMIVILLSTINFFKVGWLICSLLRAASSCFLFISLGDYI